MKNYTPQSKFVYVNGKRVGNVKDGEFRKSVHGSRHFLRFPPAIAFDVSTLDQAEAAGAVTVNITDQDTGVVYRSTIAHIRENGLSINRGHGEQIALPLEGWIIQKRGDGLQLHLWR